jgi:methionyl-tRNA formyltransferase
MKMDAGMDTGPILTQEITPIQPEDTSESLHDRLASLGAALMLQTIPDYVAGKIQARPQPSDGVSHAPKIKKSDGQIDWNQPAASIWNRVRGLVPWPGAFTHLESPESSPAGVASPPSPNPLQGQLLKIWQAQVVELSGTAGQVLQADRAGILVACGRDALCIQILQREGGRRLAAAEFLAGHPMHPGLHLK